MDLKLDLARAYGETLNLLYFCVLLSKFDKFGQKTVSVLADDANVRCSATILKELSLRCNGRVICMVYGEIW